ncbi:hypothetical protein FB451DRAFT_1375700, partial [Mycena latifolia]
MARFGRVVSEGQIDAPTRRDHGGLMRDVTRQCHTNSHPLLTCTETRPPCISGDRSHQCRPYSYTRAYIQDNLALGLPWVLASTWNSMVPPVGPVDEEGFRIKGRRSSKPDHPDAPCIVRIGEIAGPSFLIFIGDDTRGLGKVGRWPRPYLNPSSGLHPGGTSSLSHSLRRFQPKSPRAVPIARPMRKLQLEKKPHKRGTIRRTRCRVLYYLPLPPPRRLFHPLSPLSMTRTMTGLARGIFAQGT